MHVYSTTLVDFANDSRGGGVVEEAADASILYLLHPMEAPLKDR